MGRQSLSASLGVVIHHYSRRAFVGLCSHQNHNQSINQSISCLRCAALALPSSLPPQTVLELMLFTAGLARPREDCGLCQSCTAETAEPAAQAADSESTVTSSVLPTKQILVLSNVSLGQLQNSLCTLLTFFICQMGITMRHGGIIKCRRSFFFSVF